MQNWGKFSLFAIRVMGEVQIVLLRTRAWCKFTHYSCSELIDTRVRARV
jgi:hypothetical protein